jgi:DNA (cytosine-5)-methyltransferase 1
MNHIGLFEGIGGFSLAARWMGWETIAWCEWNEFGQKVLKHHFPKAQPHGDITKTDFTIYRGQCDVLTGGFPCQPYSLAGKRKGKADDRHLWPEMLRAIREIQPTWVVGENVFGLVNWDGGLVFNEVQADLEAEGYEVFPYVLPAVSVNAPHRRDRIWFVAYSTSSRLQRDVQRHGDALQFNEKRRPSNMFNSSSFSQWKIKKRSIGDIRASYGLSEGLDDCTISEGKITKESIKAFGNAIVPQVAFQIFKTIKLYNETV